MLDLRELKTFRKVAMEKSFTRAANLLHYAQSSVTAHVHSLEEEMGVPLFDRMGRRVELTLAGRQLLNYADKLLDMAEEAKRAVQNDGQPAGSLVVGAPETLVAYRLPELLKRFQMQYPAVHLSLLASEFCATGAGEISLAPNVDIAFKLRGPLQPSHLAVECLRPETLLLAVSPEHPLAGKKKVKAQAIGQHQVLLTNRACGYRALFERTLMGEGVVIGPSLEFLSVEAIKQCALAMIGIAVLPEVVIANELKRGTLVTVDWPKKPMLAYTQMLRHKDKWMSPVMSAFWNLASSLLRREAGKNR